MGQKGFSAGSDGFHLYVADDDQKTVVALLAPRVAGSARHTTIGPITVVSPNPVRRPGYPGFPMQLLPAQILTGVPSSGAGVIAAIGALVGVGAGVPLTVAVTPWLGVPVGTALLLLGYWQGIRRQQRVARRWPDSHHVLTNVEDRHLFQEARVAVGHSLRLWPALRELVDLEDPAPTMARCLWHLANTLTERETVRETAAKLVLASRTVPVNSPVHAELAGRLDQATQALKALDADLSARIGHLRRLADSSDRFVRREQTLLKARIAVRDADRILGTAGTGPGTDAGADLAERTTAILAAYQELSAQLTHEP